ncbi:Importin-11 [Rhizophlyctis rosea]|nr:Importin-11 [Rhizophlyctis rosea]
MVQAVGEGQAVDNEEMLQTLKVAYVALKCLRRTIVYGFPAFETVEDPARLFQSLIEYLQKYLHIRRTLNTATRELFDLIDKMIRQVGKFYLDVQKAQILHFVMAAGSMDVIKFYWGLVEEYVPGGGAGGGSSDVAYQKVLLQALILLKNVLKNSEFSVINKKEMESKMTTVKQILSTQLLTADFVVNATQVLVSKYLFFSKDELDTWQDDPEAFVQEEDSDHWEYVLRKCAEKVLMNMVSTNRAVLAPVLINMLTHVISVEDPDPKALLLKDAVYCAIGLCAHDLYDYVDFDSWYNTRLVHEARIEGQNQFIIRRRVAWLLGSWVPVKSTPQILPSVYTTLLLLLSPQEDTVVRLTAVLHLQYCVDMYEFDPEIFQPFLEKTLELVTGLMGELGELDVRMKCLGVLGVLIERMEGSIGPFAGRVVGLVPELWEASEKEEMFRAAIVGTLGKLVGAVGAGSVAFHGLIVPIVSYSIDTSNPAHVYLLEDGIELWLAMVRNASECTPQLLSLLPHMTQLLQFDSESLRQILKIVEGYALLGPAVVLQACGVDFFTRLTEMFATIQPVAAAPLIRCLDTMIQACVAAGCFAGIRDLMAGTGCSERLVKTIVAGEEINVVLVGFVTVLARMVLYDAGWVIGFCRGLGGGVVGGVVAGWCEKFDSMSYGKQRKLSAMALANLLTTNDPEVMQNVPAIFSIMSSALFDVKDLDRDGAMIYTFESRDEDEDESCPDGRRRQALKAQDPVVNGGQNLASYLKERLGECARVNGGGEGFRMVLGGVDPVILQQIETLLA